MSWKSCTRFITSSGKLLQMDFPASSSGRHCYSSSHGGSSARYRRSDARDDGLDDFEVGEKSGSKHPKHLKGRAIGLWYAQRNKRQRGDGEERERREFLSNVSIDGSIAKKLDECTRRLENEMLTVDPNSARPLNKLIACGSSSDGPRKRANRTAAIQESRARLPVYKARAEIIQAINENQVTVISGETGSGKTTQVPQFILDQFMEDDKQERCYVVCTQPRRISAITVAERVAYERGEAVGENSVGYKIRLEGSEPKGNSGKILFCTTGIILQFLHSDPLLKNITHLIVDEVHERSIDSDLLLGVLREKILPERPELKVICMSATLDSSTFISYFGESCGSISVEGKLFPIKDHFIEDFLGKLRYHPDPRSAFDHRLRESKLERAHRLKEYGYNKAQIRALSEIPTTKVDCDLVVACVEHICTTSDEGAILVFMPGWDGISEVCKKLSELNSPAIRPGNSRILPLHSMLPTSDQRLVFDVPPKNVRKIIVSTVLAETSVTIEDVVYVVDSGKTKLTTIDVGKNNLNCLGQLWISKANARQRLGRAGRVRPGECYKIYTKMDYEAMEDYQQPEMLRTGLENLILYVKELELGEPEVFLPRCISPPSTEAVENSIKFLIQLKALDKNGKVTALGKYLTRLPTEARLAKMLILGTLFGCLEPVMSICAALDFKDPFVQPMGKLQEVDSVRLKFADEAESDHVMIANAAEEAFSHGERFCRANFLSPQTIKMMKDLRRQYKAHLEEQGLVETCSHPHLETLRAVICGGLYPGIAMARVKQPAKGPKSFTHFRVRTLHSESEQRITFHPKSVLAKRFEFNTPFFAYFLKQRGDSGVSLFDSTAVHPLSLLLFAADCDYSTRTQIFTINKWMKIQCKRSNAILIMRLRVAFDHVLECFIRREHKEVHKEFIDLLTDAFEREYCGMVQVTSDEAGSVEQKQHS